jgi:hypothetical protein
MECLSSFYNYGRSPFPLFAERCPRFSSLFHDIYGLRHRRIAHCPEIEIVGFMPRPGIPAVVAKQTPKPLAAAHLPFFGRSALRLDDPVFQSLVVPFPVVMLTELIDCPPQGTLSNEDHPIQALRQSHRHQLHHVHWRSLTVRKRKLRSEIGLRSGIPTH